MTRGLPAVVVAILSASLLDASMPGASTGAQHPAPQEQAYRGAANLVSIFATVTDADGRLVTDLTRDDFEVRDNGRKQPLAVFSNELQPFSAVVMLDRSGSMDGEVPGTSDNRWEVAVQVVDTVTTAFDATINFGLATYSSCLPGGCSAGSI